MKERKKGRRKEEWKEERKEYPSIVEERRHAVDDVAIVVLPTLCLRPRLVTSSLNGLPNRSNVLWDSGEF